jgi:hypothetical protein
MNPSEEFRQIYTGGGLRLLVECRGESCRFELQGETAALPPSARLNLAVWFQPRDTSGLPRGFATVLGRLPVALRPLGDGQRFAGGGRLPQGITASVARCCHFRIERGMLEFPSGPHPDEGVSSHA